MDYYLVNGELYHYGIKGQKWGVRRYQNPDGSLTDAGMKRYGVSGKQYLDAKAAKKDATRAYNKAFDKAYDKNYQTYSFRKSKREASRKRWEEAADRAEDLRNARKQYKTAKEQMKNDRTRGRIEARVTAKHERRGASPESAQKLGKAYADKVLANKQYSKDFDAVTDSWVFWGKKYEAKVNKMVESLNDYWIANDTYKIQKVLTEAEERRSKGWR